VLLIHGSEESETSTLTRVGAAAVLLLCVAVAAMFVVGNSFRDRSNGRISVVINASYAGQGVRKGTAVVMHGLEVGQVTDVSSSVGGGVRLAAELQTAPIAGLTDTVGIDFRPVNYFGVTGINLIPGTGGHALRDGITIDTEPRGNFTLQALLSRLGEVSHSAITPQLIQVVDKATRYTDALNPLLETLLIVTKAVAAVQTVPTAQLLANATGLSIVFPSVADTLTDFGDRYAHSGYGYSAGVSDDFYKSVVAPSAELAATGLLTSVGKLEGKHMRELLPVVEETGMLADVVPSLLQADGIAHTLVEMRSRFEKMYSGTPEQRALQVRIVLDLLPGVAAPLGLDEGRP
jgi:ABC-type transporter Mla subunit MlaD